MPEETARLVRTLGALVEACGLHGQQLGEVAMGAVLKHSSDWNIGREVALSSGLSPLTPGITLQRACGTSLDTIAERAGVTKRTLYSYFRSKDEILFECVKSGLQTIEVKK